MSRIFGKIDYYSNLDTANHFANIEPVEEHLGEDEKFIYLKLKKTEPLKPKNQFRFDGKHTTEDWQKKFHYYIKKVIATAEIQLFMQTQ